MIFNRKLLLLGVVIIILIVLFMFFYPVKTFWSDEELQALGITNATCDANNRCQEGYECVALPIKGQYNSIGEYVEARITRCVPKDLDLCGTFCNRFRGCMIAYTLPPILECK